MRSSTGRPTPRGLTHTGGVLVGRAGARQRLVLYEDPQCPSCRQFEEIAGDLLRRETIAGTVAVEYRMRCSLGPESVRANNALICAAELGAFDHLRQAIFTAQPREHSGGFSTDDLLTLSRTAGLSSGSFEAAVRAGVFQAWVQRADLVFADENPEGPPAARLDGRLLHRDLLFDPDALGAVLRG